MMSAGRKHFQIYMTLFALSLFLLGCGKAQEVSGEPVPSPLASQAPGSDDQSPESNFETAKDALGTVDPETVSDTEHNESSPQAADTLPAPGKRTLRSLLSTAVEPLGNTMYIWGGGWNEEDTGSGIESVTLGVSPEWKVFADKQDASYDFRVHKYEIHEGLDCSGYIGWLIYNVMEDESYSGDASGYADAGYVRSSGTIAESLADMGFGDEQDSFDGMQFLPGDIVSMDGHVWMALGTCADNSVLLIHSSPPGVRISGTLLSDGSESIAVKYAEELMEKYFPEWHERYPECFVKHNYLVNVKVMRWNRETLSDEENLLTMDPKDLMELILDHQ